MHIRPFEPPDEAAVVALWDECRLTRALMQQVEALLLARGCPKVSLLVRTSNPEAMRRFSRS